jgi:hypothetical protein
LGRGVVNAHRIPEFRRSRLSLELLLVCHPGDGVFDAGLPDRRKYLMPKFSQVGGRKISQVADTKGIKAVAEKLFPIYRIGCLEQLHKLGHGGAFPQGPVLCWIVVGDTCVGTHGQTS